VSEEPSVLDYVRSRLMPWKYERVEIPPSPEDEARAFSAAASSAAASPSPQDAADQAVAPLADVVAVKMVQEEVWESPGPAPSSDLSPVPTHYGWPWRSLAALLFALAGQLSWEPPEPAALQGVILYALAAALLIWAIFRGEWQLAPYRPDRLDQADPLTVRRLEFWAGSLLAVLAFFSFGGNRFNSLNVLVWLSSLGLMVRAFWLPGQFLASSWANLKNLWRSRRLQFTFTGWTVLILVVCGMVLFFRFYQLNAVPPEMVSDHAEKLLDIYDVAQGELRIFFPRNTGREFVQMYLTAWIAQVLNTGFSFLSMKLGMVLAGLLTLPFLYLTGKEIANSRVGILALVFGGIAYWPNVLSRVALRFALYPLFTAPLMFFLIRGLRRRSRNDIILAGVFLGLGLHGYTPMRIVPLLVLVAFGLYLIHAQSRGGRKQAVYHLFVLAFFSLLVFLPLLRYMLDDPDGVAFRALSRVGSLERDLPGSPMVIFFQNLWNALKMYNWNDGQIWVHSVTGRPALDVVSGALFLLGALLVIVRYLRQRHWLDLFLLLSVPILMLPSILSLAFPAENPSLNRTGAAMIPVFLIIALALDGLLRAIEVMVSQPRGRQVAWAVTGVLVVWSVAQNYDLVFNQYKRNYTLSSWNTSEIGAVIRDFTNTFGDSDHAWVVAYPHWVDTRLVGINAGFPLRDFAIWPEQLAETSGLPGTKLFIVKADDASSLDALYQIYPEGSARLHPAQEGKEFYIFLVPGAPLSGARDPGSPLSGAGSNP
jgi:hypothetical protein